MTQRDPSRPAISRDARRPPPKAPAPPPDSRAWTRWWPVLRGTFDAIVSDQVGLSAAGCAFWATLALFPSIGMLVSLYGLVLDPHALEPQLATLRDLLPPAAFALIAARVNVLVSHGSGTLGLSLLVTTVIAFWSSATGTKSMLAALNLAYQAKEQRGFLAFQVLGLTLTLCAILGVSFGLAILVGLPAVAGFFGLSAYLSFLAQACSLVLLLTFVMFSVSALYRFGPARRPANWHWISPGSVLATVLWLLASLVVSYYVGHLASFDATYGPLGAVAGVMMWFWVSAYAVLAGAELNAQIAARRALA